MTKKEERFQTIVTKLNQIIEYQERILSELEKKEKTKSKKTLNE